MLLSLALALAPAQAAFVKGPYLQQPTPTSMVIMWETDVAAGSRVDYDGGFVEDATPVTIHSAAFSGRTVTIGPASPGRTAPAAR